ncbi:MAG: 4-hydroxythreonine-4-phosphate dehydrogenase PdxA [Bacteroidota bacterium]|jgi:4-hydroxythreonine-4-phosphate dehydrogenase
MSGQHETEDSVVVGITMGDINGVGPELLVKLFSDTRMNQVCTPVIFGASKVLSFYKKSLNNTDFNFTTIRSSEEIVEKRTNVINCWDEDAKVEPGMPSADGGKYAFAALQSACKHLADGHIDVLVTGPIDKKTMQQDGFRFPGHTEFLAQQFSANEHLMMLVSDKLRVATVTGHVPVKDVAASLSAEKIISKIKAMQQSLRRDFGISKPRIAILGLNPHSGDNGLIGSEEQSIIGPAVKSAFEQGILAFGPYGADGFFGSASFKSFDGVLAMYHDQGLIPFKALAFESGVNFTAGLPIVRTSPDHGTAYDIAGKGLASEDSIRSAIYLACDIFRQRQIHDEITASPLKFSKLGGDR